MAAVAVPKICRERKRKGKGEKRGEGKEGRLGRGEKGERYIINVKQPMELSKNYKRYRKRGVEKKQGKGGRRDRKGQRK